MIRNIMAALVLVLGAGLAGASNAADGLAGPEADAAPAVVAKYAGIRSGKIEMSRPWRVVPVAACSAECCCQIYDGSSMVYKCTSHENCINDGGLCKAKTDAKCN
jgi:hypothetical protein